MPFLLVSLCTICMHAFLALPLSNVDARGFDAFKSVTKVTNSRCIDQMTCIIYLSSYRCCFASAVWLLEDICLKRLFPNHSANENRIVEKRSNACCQDVRCPNPSDWTLKRL